MRTMTQHPAIPVYLNRVNEDPLVRMELSYDYSGPITYLQQLPYNEAYIVLDPQTLNASRDEDIEFDIWLEGLHGIEVRWVKEDCISGCKMSLNAMTEKVGLYIYPPLKKDAFDNRFDLPAPGFFIIPV